MHRPLVMSRKAWEHVAITRAVEAAGLLHEGSRGLGFGVGREPLVADFASRGVQLVATDLSIEDPRAGAWAATGQHALSVDSLRDSRICPDEVLTANTQVRAVDMNRIPGDLRDFDFVWSSCAFEHLGTLEAGLAFVEHSMECLKPGGLAVHTTEFNLSSNSGTVTEGQTVIYRQHDMDDLHHRMKSQGHDMSPFTVGPPAGLFDHIIDIPPYHDGGLVVRLDDFLVTSAVVIVRKAE